MDQPEPLTGPLTYKCLLSLRRREAPRLGLKAQALATFGIRHDPTTRNGSTEEGEKNGGKDKQEDNSTRMRPKRKQQQHHGVSRERDCEDY